MVHTRHRVIALRTKSDSTSESVPRGCGRAGVDRSPKSKPVTRTVFVLLLVLVLALCSGHPGDPVLAAVALPVVYGGRQHA